MPLLVQKERESTKKGLSKDQFSKSSKIPPQDPSEGTVGINEDGQRNFAQVSSSDSDPNDFRLPQPGATPAEQATPEQPAEQAIFTVTLRAEASIVPAPIQLRQFLTLALRGFNLRCIEVVEASEQEKSKPEVDQMKNAWLVRRSG